MHRGNSRKDAHARKGLGSSVGKSSLTKLYTAVRLQHPIEENLLVAVILNHICNLHLCERGLISSGSLYVLSALREICHKTKAHGYGACFSVLNRR